MEGEDHEVEQDTKGEQHPPDRRVSPHTNYQIHRQQDQQEPSLFMIGYAQEQHHQNTLFEKLFNPFEMRLGGPTEYDVLNAMVEEWDGPCQNEGQEQVEVREEGKVSVDL